MTESIDPATSLERKLTAFADTLSDDELTVLHDVMHLAREGSEVEGFAMQVGGLHSADPCEGGQVTFPTTFAMIGNLHVSLHRGQAPPGPPIIPPIIPGVPGGVPIPYPN